MIWVYKYSNAIVITFLECLCVHRTIHKKPVSAFLAQSKLQYQKPCKFLHDEKQLSSSCQKRHGWQQHNTTTHNHLFERMNRPASQYQSTQVDWNKITQVLHQWFAYTYSFILYLTVTLFSYNLGSKKDKKWNKITRKYNWKRDFKILSEKRGFRALFSLLSRILVNKSTMKCFWQKWNLDEEDKMGLSPTQGNTSRYVRTELPDQLRMIIPFSKEIIGPAGVFVHVFTCKLQHWLLLSRGGVLYTVSYQSYEPGTKVRSCDVRTKSRTFSDLKSVCLSGLHVRKL